MNMDNHKRITDLVEEKLAEIGGFIVDITIVPNAKIEILIDKEEGLNIRDCVQVSRHVESTLEEESNEILTSHGLEVCSPGLDYPLKHFKQYVKNVGRKVYVKKVEGEDVTGELLDVTEEGITVEAEIKQKGKKRIEKAEVFIPFQEIKETKIVISFK